MVVDHDLSNLAVEQAEFWVCLQAAAIRGQIMAAQAERLGFPFVLGLPAMYSIYHMQQASFPTLNAGRA